MSVPNEIMAAPHHDADDGSLVVRAKHADDGDKAAIAKVNCSHIYNITVRALQHHRGAATRRVVKSDSFFLEYGNMDRDVFFI